MIEYVIPTVVPQKTPKDSFRTFILQMQALQHIYFCACFGLYYTYSNPVATCCNLPFRRQQPPPFAKVDQLMVCAEAMCV